MGVASIIELIVYCSECYPFTYGGIMTRFHVVASVAALLLLAGCVSTEEYNKATEDRDLAIGESKMAKEANDTLSDQLKKAEQKLDALQKAQAKSDKEKGDLEIAKKDLGDRLAAATAEAGKAKQDLVAAQNEAKESASKVKLLENQVGELKAQVAKNTSDSDKAKDELKATIEKLTVDLNDAKAQIQKLEEAAKEMKGEAKPETKVAPEKVIEPKPIDVNKANQPKAKDAKVKDTKGSKVEKQ